MIKAKALTKLYNNEVKAVDEIELHIEKGEVYGLLGPNGAGKSTLIKMICGLIAPNSGELFIDGIEITDNSEYINKKIGYVPQELVFFDHLTVRENLSLFSSALNLKNEEQRIDELLKLLSLEELENRRSDQMSGGQKRRLNLGIGLLHNPEILVLDEPSAGMDPQSRNVLWNVIENMTKENTTIILTTHLMETADRLSDRIAIIDRGKVAVVDTPKNLKLKYGEPEVIELLLSDRLSEEQITQIATITGGTLKNQLLKIQTSDGVQSMIEITETITEEFGKHAIRRMSISENTLEDVFIQLTGRELRE